MDGRTNAFARSFCPTAISGAEESILLYVTIQLSLAQHSHTIAGIRINLSNSLKWTNSYLLLQFPFSTIFTPLQLVIQSVHINKKHFMKSLAYVRFFCRFAYFICGKLNTNKICENLMFLVAMHSHIRRVRHIYQSVVVIKMTATERNG